MIFLIFITYMVFLYIFEHRQLRGRNQRQRKRLADLEVNVMDLKGRILLAFGCLLLDDDDDFKLSNLHTSLMSLFP